MKQRPKQNANTDYKTRIYAAYSVTIGIVLIASIFPENRIWGINQWTYFPPVWRLVLISLGLLLPPIGSFLFGGKGKSLIDSLDGYLERKHNYLKLSALIITLMSVSFYFLRAKAHFLGDGYMNLGSLASAKPLIKVTGFGEVKAHIWLKSLIGEGEPAALLSFQIISILSGIILVMAVFFLASKLFDKRLDSFLFSLGVVSGGYMLLSFGYIEYYSLFVLSVTIYTLTGLLIINGKLNKWWAIPLLLPTVLFHILGMTLLPSVMFLLFSGTKLDNFFQKMSKKTVLFLSFIGVMALSSLFIYFYLTSYRFRFAVVPILTDRFTVEGYTLFSLKHIADFVNLLFLLVPGLLVFLVLTPKLSLKENIRHKPFQFLLILTISTLGTVFLLDPKLGMPRDWDLFSYCGIPLTLLIYFSIVTSGQTWKNIGISLMIALGFLSFFPRATRQSIPELSAAEFKTYSSLDLKRNRVSRNLLIDFYSGTGQYSKATNELTSWYKDYPERTMLVKADSLFRADMTVRAIQIVYKVLETNPYYTPAYCALGKAYLDVDQLDSAVHYLEIANGMNPDSPEFLYALGTAYIAKGEFQIAFRHFRKAISIGLDSVSVRKLENTYPELNR